MKGWKHTEMKANKCRKKEQGPPHLETERRNTKGIMDGCVRRTSQRGERYNSRQWTDRRAARCCAVFVIYAQSYVLHFNDTKLFVGAQSILEIIFISQAPLVTKEWERVI
jgi:hypothetical protein